MLEPGQSNMKAYIMMYTCTCTSMYNVINEMLRINWKCKDMTSRDLRALDLVL